MSWLKSVRGWLNRPPPQIPEPLWVSTIAQLPFLGYLSERDQQRLRKLTEALLHKKPFSGAAGFELSDATAVLIAVQAALPVLNLSLDLYDDLSAVIVTADAFPIRQQVVDNSGVVHEWEETLAGVAIDMGGAVLLSWPDLSPTTQNQDNSPAHNLVIHEFAHKIDMRRGGANGYPPFLAGLHERADLGDWSGVFSRAYDDFCSRIDEIESRLPEDFDPDDARPARRHDTLLPDLPMDPYASRDPAEFFAVASETFFVSPAALAGAYPQVYRLLAHYYLQDPLASAACEHGKTPD